MPQVVIENPILNSPYTEPTRHFRFSDEGITDPWNARQTIRSALTGLRPTQHNAAEEGKP